MASLYDDDRFEKTCFSYSISSRYSLEGSVISMVISCITACVLYICLGVVFYGPTCGGGHGSLQNGECADVICMVCQSSFVSMNMFNHIILAIFISLQSILGSLLIDIVIKAYSYKLTQIYSARKDKRLLIWLQRFSSFIFAFAVTFYYLLL